MELGSITRLLQEVQDGATGAEDRLFDRVYAELKQIAVRKMSHERPHPAAGGATDLVHNAFQRLDGEAFENRRHLFFAYARAMRQILIEAARSRKAIKHGGAAPIVPFNEAQTAAAPSAASMVLDAVEVDRLIERLRNEMPRAADVVSLRFFGGLGDEHIAEILNVDTRTVRRDWADAKRRFKQWLTARGV